MNSVPTAPQVGEVWEVGGFNSLHFVAKAGLALPSWCSGQLIDTFGTNGSLKWAEMNGLEAVVIEIDGSTASGSHKVFFKNDRRVWVRLPPNYLMKCVGAVKLGMHANTINTVVGAGYQCCSPSVGMCRACKLESHVEKVAKGYVYNQWTRSYVKKRK